MADPAHTTIGFFAIAFSPLGMMVLLVKKRQKQVWGLPKGHKINGESDVQTACRELHEETGCKPVLLWGNQGWTCDENEIVSLGDFYRSTVKSNGEEKRKVTKYFVATVETVGSTEDIQEIEETRWVSLLSVSSFLPGPELAYFHSNFPLLSSLPNPNSH